MQSEITENIQSSIRPGEAVDTFYYGETNQELQAYPCVVNNKFVQAFTNLGAGTSQFVISPNQGVSDIVMSFMMPSDLSGLAGFSLPEGWGYSLIRQVSVRYGSSAQYFFSGEQIWLQTMWDAEDARKRDNLASLGGNLCNDAQCSGAAAYVYLNLPHNSPRADGKPLPFPSDLLVQPIVITVELNSVPSLFVVNTTTPSAGSPPPALASAQLQVKQEMMQDSADLLARRVDMNVHAYTFPLKYFPQQEVQINLQAGLSQTVNLTGFRAGEVRNILLWLSKGSDQTTYGSHYWEPLNDVVLTYNGEIFFRADKNVSQLWNLVNDTKEAGVNLSVVNTSNPTGAQNYLSTWVDIPFSQTNIPYDKEVKLVHGKPILNAVVNLTFTVPSSATDWTLHAVYLYNASLLCSRGSAEYIF
jgi:hypothetical protein